MKNNKGQVLVAFILLLPVLVMLLGLLVDCGYLYYEKRRVDNNLIDALKYGLNNIDEDANVLKSKIRKQLNLNIEDIQKLDIKIEDNIIEIELKKVKKGIFTVIFSKYQYDISGHYKGYKDMEKIIIRKV